MFWQKKVHHTSSRFCHAEATTVPKGPVGVPSGELQLSPRYILANALGGVFGGGGVEYWGMVATLKTLFFCFKTYRTGTFCHKAVNFHQFLSTLPWFFLCTHVQITSTKCSLCWVTCPKKAFSLGSAKSAAAETVWSETRLAKQRGTKRKIFWSCNCMWAQTHDNSMFSATRTSVHARGIHGSHATWNTGAFSGNDTYARLFSKPRKIHAGVAVLWTFPQHVWPKESHHMSNWVAWDNTFLKHKPYDMGLPNPVSSQSSFVSYFTKNKEALWEKAAFLTASFFAEQLSLAQRYPCLFSLKSLPQNLEIWSESKMDIWCILTLVTVIRQFWEIKKLPQPFNHKVLRIFEPSRSAVCFSR